jgi:hypothetical protein
MSAILETRTRWRFSKANSGLKGSQSKTNQVGLRDYENIMFGNAASHKIVFLRGLSDGLPPGFRPAQSAV